jgi:hypothetical protein
MLVGEYFSVIWLTIRGTEVCCGMIRGTEVRCGTSIVEHLGNEMVAEACQKE